VLRLLVMVALVVGCGADGRLLSNSPAVHPTVAPASPTGPPASDPQPVVFPRDEGAHDRLTEWWYYTGHLVGSGGSRFGFEFVIFRAERGGFPVSWASHLALTDEVKGTFVYEQRSEIGPQVDVNEGDGFALRIHGSDDNGVIDAAASPWEMGGLGVVHGLDAKAKDFGLSLSLADNKRAEPVLHDGDGWVDFGDAGSSYYYSRPRMDATGTLTLGDRSMQVLGTAWFDHQWGDFIAVGGGGWDWFALNLGDGTDLTLSLVRAADGTYPLAYGTLVASDGRVKHLSSDDFTVESLGTWTSPRTGATYPSGWHIEIPGEYWQIDLAPTVADQELDTRETTGVIYWEGSQNVTATRATAVGSEEFEGRGYVELTGYAP
jgi:predicted secreted hydrolase